MVRGGMAVPAGILAHLAAGRRVRKDLSGRRRRGGFGVLDPSSGKLKIALDMVAVW